MAVIRMKIKKLFIILISIVFSVIFPLMAMAGESYLSYIQPDISYNIKTAGVNVRYPMGENSDTVFCNGRLCVPLEKGTELMGAQFNKNGGMYRISLDGKHEFFNIAKDSNRPVVFGYDGEVYISIYELITPFDYEITANLAENSVEILKDSPDIGRYGVSGNGSSKAYIRIEDIVADGLKPGGGSYSVDMLEKLKYTAEYLYLGNQQYYIAWIPVYACPKENCWNDVSQEYNLYNSYFLYVMDYMVDHNGHLGLHGYTHQYGSDESGVGFEWGSSTPFNFNEQQRRMIAAKDTCRRLGYKEEFFEFPHYRATNEQLLMAEHYFDAVYQAYPDDKLMNYLTYTTRSGKGVYYIPTPGDYIHFKRDDSVFDKLAHSINSGYAVSLFYHPVIDEEKIEMYTREGKRAWTYSDEGSLPRIVNYVLNHGYSFSVWN